MNPDKHVDIVRLIVRSMEGKLSEEETRELAQWRAARPRHDEIFRRMTSEDHFIESVRLFVKVPTNRNGSGANCAGKPSLEDAPNG